MNLQTIFSTVKNHLLKQNERATGEYSNCVYYDEVNNRKCAVGCLIKPSVYNQSMELKTVDRKELIPFLRKSGVFIANEPSRIRKRKKLLLRALQRVHDNVYIHWWESRLKEVAEKFKLHY